MCAVYESSECGRYVRFVIDMRLKNTECVECVKVATECVGSYVTFGIDTRLKNIECVEYLKVLSVWGSCAIRNRHKAEEH